MKTPHFWYPQSYDVKASLMVALLAPLSWAFKAGTVLRRLAANPYRSHVPVICVGNVVVGGAGKTPTCLALAQLFKNQGYKPVFVTRGYGGAGQKIWVDLARHYAVDVGDEALLLAAVAPTCVGRDRAQAVRQAESHGDIILMDDGLQNPYITPTAALLVVDGEVGFGNGHIIPAGPLREDWRRAIKRVAAVIIIGEDKHHLALQLPRTLPVFRAHLRPHIAPGFPRRERFVAFAGIGRPEKFYATARAAGLDIADTQDFPDHHFFDEFDINKLRLLAEENGALLLTTTKDAIRLPADFRAEVVVLPVSLVFEDAEAEKNLVRVCGGSNL